MNQILKILFEHETVEKVSIKKLAIAIQNTAMYVFRAKNGSQH
jgi:hypothetical protein